MINSAHRHDPPIRRSTLDAYGMLPEGYSDDSLEFSYPGYPDVPHDEVHLHHRIVSPEAHAEAPFWLPAWDYTEPFSYENT